MLYGKRKLYESDSLFKDLLETYTLFGDPAMRLQVPRPDIAVTKVVEPAGVVQPGDVVTYTMSVSNQGTVTAFDVTITDTVPSNLQPLTVDTSGVPLSLAPGTTYVWTAAEMAPGAQVLITVTARVDPNAPLGTPIVNRLKARSSSGDANDANNEAVSISDVGTTYVIRGRTYVDSNASTTYDAGEAPLPGLTVTLHNTGGLVDTTSSDSSGVYTFTAVLPGTYTVTVTSPNGYVPTGPTSVVVLVATSSVLDINFGFISPTAVSLMSFSATPTQEGDVVLYWTVWDDSSVSYYEVLRAQTPDISAAQVVSSPLIGEGHEGQTDYTFVDHPAGGGLYYYWLRAVGENALGQVFGPLMVKVSESGSSRIRFPLVVSGG